MQKSLRKSKESNWKVFRVNCSGSGGSHEINSREINSSKINSREINFLENNTSRDQFLFTLLYKKNNNYKNIQLQIRINNILNSL